MRSSYGKDVFETIQEIVIPRHTALALVDVRRHDPEMLPRLAELVSAARTAGMLLVWIDTSDMVYPTDVTTDPAPALVSAVPVPGDLVLDKIGANAFIGTPLGILLRQRGIHTIVTAGLTTEGAVESTAEGAGHHDFYSVVATDCIASFDPVLHLAALDILQARCEVVTSSFLIGEWTG